MVTPVDLASSSLSTTKPEQKFVNCASLPPRKIPTETFYGEMAPIQTIEYFRVPPRWLFVKITDSEGNVGWGEASLEGHTEAVEGCLDAFTERFVGFDAKYDISGNRLIIPGLSRHMLISIDAVTLSISGKMAIAWASTGVDRS